MPTPGVAQQGQAPHNSPLAWIGPVLLYVIHSLSAQSVQKLFLHLSPAHDCRSAIVLPYSQPMSSRTALHVNPCVWSGHRVCRSTKLLRIDVPGKPRLAPHKFTLANMLVIVTGVPVVAGGSICAGVCPVQPAAGL